jgi:hypothetical protein
MQRIFKKILTNSLCLKFSEILIKTGQKIFQNRDGNPEKTEKFEGKKHII